MTLTESLSKYDFSWNKHVGNKVISKTGCVLCLNLDDNPYMSLSDITSNDWEEVFSISFAHFNCSSFDKDFCLLGKFNVIVNDISSIIPFNQRWGTIIVNSLKWFTPLNLTHIVCKDIVFSKKIISSRITINGMFKNFEELTYFGNNPFKKVTEAISAFENCPELRYVDTNGFENIENAERMFSGDKELLSTISFDNFKKVSIANRMFQGCESLTTLNISSFENLNDTEAMFTNCINLSKIILPKVFPICMNTFKNCLNLRNITYMGTKEDWLILKNTRDITGNNLLFNVKVLCTDGEFDM